MGKTPNMSMSDHSKAYVNFCSSDNMESTSTWASKAPRLTCWGQTGNVVETTHSHLAKRASSIHFYLSTSRSFADQVHNRS